MKKWDNSLLKKRGDLSLERTNRILSKLGKEQDIIAQSERKNTQRVDRIVQINLLDIENFSNVSQSYEFNRQQIQKKISMNRECKKVRAVSLQTENSTIHIPKLACHHYWAHLVYNQSRHQADKFFKHL